MLEGNISPLHIADLTDRAGYLTAVIIIYYNFYKPNQEDSKLKKKTYW